MIAPGRALQERARTTRALLLDAAAVEFSARGFSAASINTIPAAAGRTKGAMYFRFTSKDALGHAVARAHYTAIAQPWRAGKPGVGGSCP